MEWHLLLGISLFVAAGSSSYKARKDPEFGRRDAWSAAMMAGLGLTEILPLLTPAMLPAQVVLMLIDFAYGVAVTAAVAAAIEKSPPCSVIDGKLLQCNEGLISRTGPNR